MGVCRNHGRPREVTIEREELRKLLEYSCSVPTGTTLGKRWRIQLHFGSGVPIEQREWLVREYLECHCCEEGQVAIAEAWAIDPSTGKPHRGELDGQAEAR
jgi:hypothetical protein